MSKSKNIKHVPFAQQQPVAFTDANTSITYYVMTGKYVSPLMAANRMVEEVIDLFPRGSRVSDVRKSGKWFYVNVYNNRGRQVGFGAIRQGSRTRWLEEWPAELDKVA